MGRLFLLVTILFLLISPLFVIKADELEEVTKELNNLKKDLAKKESNHQVLNQRLNEIKNKVIALEVEIRKKEEEVKKSELVLDYQKKLLNERARSYYKNLNRASSSLINFLIIDNISSSLENFFYQKSLIDEDKNTIIKIVLYIKKIEEAKKSLEAEKLELSKLKQEIGRQSQILAGEISQAKTKIAQLTTKQQQLIAQKLASLNISRSAAALTGCDSDLINGRDPGFSPKLAFFTYGVPNRVGMNQWGAYGRAKAGQNEEEILRAYYQNFELKKDYNKEININVEGYGTYNIEDYVKRIYEVPNSWAIDGFAALKAQAIAARSYALAYTNNGGRPICATQLCQVFKPEPKGGPWEQAVNETAGWVMTQGDNPIKAWYSSTHGGYIFSSVDIGWSETSWTKRGVDSLIGINNFSDLSNNAYDRDSPWFYCNWGSRPEYNKTAWLKIEEVADIVNVILLAKADPATREHLYQTDKSNPAGIENWSPEKVKSELRSRGIIPFNFVSNIIVSADFNTGKTTAVAVSGDGGGVNFDGSEFKNWFNLRAPANIQIVGPLYNVEKR